jgi:hypothetical protein
MDPAAGADRVIDPTFDGRPLSLDRRHLTLVHVPVLHAPVDLLRQLEPWCSAWGVASRVGRGVDGRAAHVTRSVVPL